MGWLGAGNVQAQQAFMENQGMWDGVDGMGMDMNSSMALNNMGMLGGMGMGMGQWGGNNNGFEGYH
jgi:hypothetical protein